jgi:protein FRA10AC1
MSAQDKHGHQLGGVKTFDSMYNNEGDRRARVVRDMARLTPEERHRKFLADYDKFYGGGKAAAAARAHLISKPTTSDAKVIQDTFRFIRSEEDDAEDSWEARMARRYHAKLFKEYCIADLSRYKEQKIGMRWRVEKEVVVGKGQFSCGVKRCDAKEDLASYEVHFGYQEAGERKEALVKLRACEACAYKLNYGRTTPHKKVLSSKEKKRQKKEERRRKRRRGEGEGGDDDDEDEGKRRKKSAKVRGKRREDESESESEESSSSSSSEGEGDDKVGLYKLNSVDP